MVFIWLFLLGQFVFVSSGEPMLRKLRELGAVGIRWKMRRRLQRTFHHAEFCQNTQEQTLSRLLSLNSDSDFSRQYLSGVANTSLFRKQFPISDYEMFAPFIERVKAGEQGALLGPKNQLLMFALTSGTTGDTKFIPVTKPFLSDYRHGWQSWAVKAFDEHPLLHQLNIFQLCSDFDKHRTPADSPCGNISGLVQHMQHPIVRLRFTVPEVAQKIRDAHSKLYLALLKSMTDLDVGLLTTANPSTLVQLAKLLKAEATLLVKDLHDGRCSVELSTDVQKQLTFKPYRKRAKQLEVILSSQGFLSPRDVWPDLTLLSVWTGGSAAAYLPQLREHFGDLPIRDHGLSASEGRMTIPLDDNTSSGLLDIESHFFEFIPLEEGEADSPSTLLAHELDVGASYFILLTTASGLYRYNIRDVVKCTGFLGTTPLLKFLHKGSHISSLTGEKLTETQVVQAVQHVTNKHSINFGEFTLTPHWDDPPYYQLLFPGEAMTSINNHISFANEVDDELKRRNSEYAEKRDTARLEALRIVFKSREEWHQLFADRRTGIGASIEQYKHPFLVPDLEFARIPVG